MRHCHGLKCHMRSKTTCAIQKKKSVKEKKFSYIGSIPTSQEGRRDIIVVKIIL